MLGGEQIRAFVESFDDQIFLHNSTRFIQVISGNQGGESIELRVERQAVSDEVGNSNAPPRRSVGRPRKEREIGEEKRQAALARREAEGGDEPSPVTVKRRRGF